MLGLFLPGVVAALSGFGTNVELPRECRALFALNLPTVSVRVPEQFGPVEERHALAEALAGIVEALHSHPATQRPLDGLAESPGANVSEMSIAWYPGSLDAGQAHLNRPITRFLPMERPRPVPLASALPTTTLRVSHVAAGEGELERWQLEIGLPPELPGANPGTTNLVLTAFQSQDSGWKLLHVQGFPGYHASIALDAQAGPPLLDGRQVWRVHLAVFDPRIGSVNLNLDWIQGQNHVRGHVLPAR